MKVTRYFKREDLDFAGKPYKGAEGRSEAGDGYFLAREIEIDYRPGQIIKMAKYPFDTLYNTSGGPIYVGDTEIGPDKAVVFRSDGTTTIYELPKLPGVKRETTKRVRLYFNDALDRYCAYSLEDDIYIGQIDTNVLPEEAQKGNRIITITVEEE